MVKRTVTLRTQKVVTSSKTGKIVTSSKTGKIVTSSKMVLIQMVQTNQSMKLLMNQLNKKVKKFIIKKQNPTLVMTKFRPQINPIPMLPWIPKIKKPPLPRNERATISRLSAKCTGPSLKKRVKTKNFLSKVHVLSLFPFCRYSNTHTKIHTSYLQVQ